MDFNEYYYYLFKEKMKKCNILYQGSPNFFIQRPQNISNALSGLKVYYNIYNLKFLNFRYLLVYLLSYGDQLKIVCGP